MLNLNILSLSVVYWWFTDDGSVRAETRMNKIMVLILIVL
jgi:hypothetical protein